MTHQFLSEEEIQAAEQRCQQATPGPLTVEKHESFPQGCWHYAIKTTYHPAEHPHSPRFVAWMCGSLGESIHSRRHPDDYRSDPQIESDADLFAHARTDLPKALADLRELRRVVRELAAMLESCVWRDRKDFPNDPYCVICGAGRAWADKHGHQPNCALALAQQVEGGK